ncbi:MAG: hypothetical protein OEL80_07045, partial [Desulfuromonadales bacterium]|nr:hypothetical protein [Desulfuromonadales bacterium]
MMQKLTQRRQGKPTKTQRVKHPFQTGPSASAPFFYFAPLRLNGCGLSLILFLLNPFLPFLPVTLSPAGDVL